MMTKRMLAIVCAAMLMGTPALAISKCDRGQRITCVVDGDTFWLEGVKYRTVGYDTPEPTTNICGGRYEKQLAAKATARFIELWNTTQIEVRTTGEKGGFNRDLVYVYSDGQDVGEILISEGLARSWPDGEKFWCR